MYFLVNHTKRELHNIFIKKLYRDDLFEQMLQEPDDISIKRKRTRELLRVLQQAFRTLDELPMEAETVERGYSLTNNDPTGLPRIHGLPTSSIYSSSASGSMDSYTASPKNQRSHYDDDQEDNNEASPSAASVDSTSDVTQNDSPSPSSLTIKSTTSPALLALERLPSGRKYWCDSPTGCLSPLRPPNVSEDNTQPGATCNDNHNSSNIVSIEKIEDDDEKDDDNTDEKEYEE